MNRVIFFYLNLHYLIIQSNNVRFFMKKNWVELDERFIVSS
jgi:hypothetical protein